MLITSNPWTVIGWIILGVAALVVLFYLLRFLLVLLMIFFGWWAIRALKKRALVTTPKEGQKWQQLSSTKPGTWTPLYIGKVFEEGGVITGFVVRTSRSEFGDGASWRESPAEWRNRINTRDCHLVSEAKPK